MSSSNGSFVNSNPLPLEWNRESIHNFLFTPTQLIQAIEEKKIASLTLVDFNQVIFSAYSPTVTRDDHGKPDRIFFSLSDKMKSESFGFFNVDDLGLYGMVDERNIPSFSRNKKLTKDHLKNTALNKENGWVAGLLPNFVALPHGVTPPQYNDFPDADLNELKDSHGNIVFTILSQLQRAGDGTHLSRSTRVINNIISAGDGVEFVSEVLDDNEVSLLQDGPHMTFSLSATSNLPEGASKLGRYFHVPPTPPRQPNQQNVTQNPTNITFGLNGSTVEPAPGQIIVVSQDAKEKADRRKLADKSTQAKRSIMFMTGTISTSSPGSFTPSVSVTNIAVPVLRENFKELDDKPKGDVRDDATHRYFHHGVTAMKENADSLNRLKAHDTDTVSRAMATAVYHANYSTASYEEVQALPTTKQLNITSFGPQSKYKGRVKAIKDANQRIQAEALIDLPEGERPKTSTSIDSFPSSGSLEDVEMTLLNSHLYHHLQFDLTRGAPLCTQTLSKLRETITDELDWIRSYKHFMPWLGAAFMIRAQNVIAGFAKLAEDYILREALAEQASTDVLRLAINSNTMQRIVNLVSIPHIFAADIASAKANNRALSQHIFCPRFYEDEEEKRQANTYTNAMTSARGGKRPVSASAERQEDTRSTTDRSYQPRIRPSVQNRKTSDKCGLLFLADGEMPPQQIFPQGLKLTFRNKTGPLCAGFCCQGKTCDRPPSSCYFLHVNNYDGLGQEYFDKLCAHLNEKKHGWLSDGMLKNSKNIKLKPQYEHLRGDEKGPYGNQNEG
eukprot:scaffold19231_cov155-Skeletonema_dohrnii-CCMP3373.AAC.2